MAPPAGFGPSSKRKERAEKAYQARKLREQRDRVADLDWERLPGGDTPVTGYKLTEDMEVQGQIDDAVAGAISEKDELILNIRNLLANIAAAETAVEDLNSQISNIESQVGTALGIGPVGSGGERIGAIAGQQQEIEQQKRSLRREIANHSRGIQNLRYSLCLAEHELFAAAKDQLGNNSSEAYVLLTHAANHAQSAAEMIRDTALASQEQRFRQAVYVNFQRILSDGTLSAAEQETKNKAAIDSYVKSVEEIKNRRLQALDEAIANLPYDKQELAKKLKQEEEKVLNNWVISCKDFAEELVDSGKYYASALEEEGETSLNSTVEGEDFNLSRDVRFGKSTVTLPDKSSTTQVISIELDKFKLLSPSGLTKACNLVAAKAKHHYKWEKVVVVPKGGGTNLSHNVVKEMVKALMVQGYSLENISVEVPGNAMFGGSMSKKVADIVAEDKEGKGWAKFIAGVESELESSQQVEEDALGFATAKRDHGLENGAAIDAAEKQVLYGAGEDESLEGKLLLGAADVAGNLFSEQIHDADRPKIFASVPSDMRKDVYLEFRNKYGLSREKEPLEFAKFLDELDEGVLLELYKQLEPQEQGEILSLLALRRTIITSVSGKKLSMLLGVADSNGNAAVLDKYISQYNEYVTSLSYSQFDQEYWIQNVDSDVVKPANRLEDINVSNIANRKNLGVILAELKKEVLVAICMSATGFDVARAVSVLKLIATDPASGETFSAKQIELLQTVPIASRGSTIAAFMSDLDADDKSKLFRELKLETLSDADLTSIYEKLDVEDKKQLLDYIDEHPGEGHDAVDRQCSLLNVAPSLSLIDHVVSKEDLVQANGAKATTLSQVNVDDIDNKKILQPILSKMSPETLLVFARRGGYFQTIDAANLLTLMSAEGAETARLNSNQLEFLDKMPQAANQRASVLCNYEDKLPPGAEKAVLYFQLSKANAQLLKELYVSREISAQVAMLIAISNPQQAYDFTPAQKMLIAATEPGQVARVIKDYATQKFVGADQASYISALVHLGYSLDRPKLKQLFDSFKNDDQEFNFLIGLHNFYLSKIEDGHDPEVAKQIFQGKVESCISSMSSENKMKFYGLLQQKGKGDAFKFISPESSPIVDEAVRPE